jgi:hypothetical protein
MATLLSDCRIALLLLRSALRPVWPLLGEYEYIDMFWSSSEECLIQPRGAGPIQAKTRRTK